MSDLIKEFVSNIELQLEAIADNTGGTGGGSTADATVTNPSVTADALILAANADRIGAVIYNDSNVDVLIKYGSGAAAGSFSVKLYAGGEHNVRKEYKGKVHAISTGAAAQLRVSEF